MSTHSLKLSYFYCVFILLCHSETALSAVTLTPSVVISVCPGDQLSLTCNTSTNLQQWTVMDPNTEMTYTRLTSVPTNTEAVITPLQVQSITLSFAVISAPNTLPLISTLTVDSITPFLNTSRISCLEIDSGKSEAISVNIIEPDPLKPNCGDLPVQQSDAQMNDSVNITGNTQDIPVMEGTTISFSCHPGLILGGPNSSTCMGNGEWEPDPREVECRVPECEIPMNKNKLVYKYNSTIKGSKLIFYCEDNPGELYIAQCYGNETWIPNIALITCGDRDQSIINEGRPFESLNLHGKIAVASSITVFALTSILFFIIGLLSGHFCHKKRKRDETIPPPTQEIQTPYYDDVVLKQQEKQELELKDNVAYVSHTVSN